MVVDIVIENQRGDLILKGKVTKLMDDKDLLKAFTLRNLSKRAFSAEFLIANASIFSQEKKEGQESQEVGERWVGIIASVLADLKTWPGQLDLSKLTVKFNKFDVEILVGENVILEIDQNIFLEGGNGVLALVAYQLFNNNLFLDQAKYSAVIQKIAAIDPRFGALLAKPSVNGETSHDPDDYNDHPEVELAQEPRPPAGDVALSQLDSLDRGLLSKATIEAITIKDSRGRDTVRVIFKIGDLETTGDVPAGASTGSREANTVSHERAIQNIMEIILPALQQSGLDLNNHADLVAAERMIIKMAGDNFKDLGANATVPVSWALWRMAAKLKDMELADYITKYEPDAVDTENDGTYFYFNVFNGGAHAIKAMEKLGIDRIPLQEIMLAIKYSKGTLAIADAIDKALYDIFLEEYEAENIGRGDESGFSIKGLGDTDKAIELVARAVERAGYTLGVDVKLATDVAANTFTQNESGDAPYDFNGEKSSQEMIEYYKDLASRYPGVFLTYEDPLGEADWQYWPELTKAMKEGHVGIVGDDLTVSQLELLERAIKEEAMTHILIKVNQGGTITTVLDTIKLAKKHGIKWIISHRSGETDDDGIADLAFGTRAYGLKTGAPEPDYAFEGQVRVRRMKYERFGYLAEREEIGGILLNPALMNLQIKRDGQGRPLPVDQQPIMNMKIEGFIPIIINIVPVTLPPIHVGMKDKGQEPAKVSYKKADPMERREQLVAKEIEETVFVN